MFPVLWQGSREYNAKLAALNCPREVPWAFIEQYRAGCVSNHDQTPEVLAARGGLAPAEIVAIVEGSATLEARRRCWNMTAEQEVERLRELLAIWEKPFSDPGVR